MHVYREMGRNLKYSACIDKKLSFILYEWIGYVSRLTMMMMMMMMVRKTGRTWVAWVEGNGRERYINCPPVFFSKFKKFLDEII